MKVKISSFTFLFIAVNSILIICVCTKIDSSKSKSSTLPLKSSDTIVKHATNVNKNESSMRSASTAAKIHDVVNYSKYKEPFNLLLFK
jgi:hypothetical protein